MKPDFSYVFTYVSSASKELLGLDPDDLVKNREPFDNLIHPDDAPGLWNAYEAAFNSGTPLRFESRFTINGELRWFVFMSCPEIHPDHSITWDGILIDITEKKLVEEVASKELTFMNILMNNLPDQIYFKDLESRFIKVNKGVLSKIGAVSDNEILMKTDFDIYEDKNAVETRNDELYIINTGKSIIDKVEKEILLSGKLDFNNKNTFKK
jgi:PAS domain S-box-containing protein